MPSSSLDAFIQSLFGQATAGVRSGFERYGRWMAGLAHAARGWAIYAQGGGTCRCVIDTPHGRAICRDIAIGMCCTCGFSVCLEHALVCPSAVVCMSCIRGLQAQQGRNPQAPAGRIKKTRVDYLKVLGLSSKATKDSIKSKYKKLVAELHPDLARNEKDRLRRTARMKEINEAYAALAAEEVGAA